MRRVFVEVNDFRREARWVERVGGERVEACEETAAPRDVGSDATSFMREPLVADSRGVSDGAVQPGVFVESDANARGTYPRLRRPIEQRTRVSHLTILGQLRHLREPAARQN